MSNGRILVVDDLSDVRFTVMGLLADEGYKVQGAATYDEALELLKNNRFHAAVLDIRLNGDDIDDESGLSLMEYIYKTNSDIIIIMMTGFAETHMIQRAYRRDSQGRTLAYSFLQKSEIRHLPGILQQAFKFAIKK